MSLYNTTPISNLVPGTAVLGTDIYAATDVTDDTQSPAGTTKKYTINQLQNYVSTQIRGVGIPSVMVATTANLVATYNNGTAGVGAVLVNAGALTALVINGVTLSEGDSVLVKDQTLSIENGIYVVTTVGSMSEAWVLTRSTYYDGASRIPNYGDFVGVISGDIDPLSFYFQTSPGPIEVGVDPMTFEREGAVANGFTWNDLATTTVSAAINNGYIISNASLSSVTLPSVAAEGSVIAIQGKGAGGWLLQCGVGQTVNLGAVSTSSGGTLGSSNRYDNVQVVCITANTGWAVSYAFSAGLIVT